MVWEFIWNFLLVTHISGRSDRPPCIVSRGIYARNVILGIAHWEFFHIILKKWSLEKGQLISKADWRAIDSPKKRKNEFVLFAFLFFTANKSNSSVRFLGESMVHQSASNLIWPLTTLQLMAEMKQICNVWAKYDRQSRSGCCNLWVFWIPFGSTLGKLLSLFFHPSWMLLCTNKHYFWFI